MLAGVVGLLIAGLVAGVVRTQVQNGFGSGGAIFGCFLATIAALCFWFAVGSGGPAFQYAIRGGAILGGVGFVAGYFGPIFFMPGANLGPLLGIFGTGPIGFIFGTIGGAIVGLIRYRR